MKVRYANKFDLQYYINLVHKIHKQGDIGLYDVPLNNDYLNTLFNITLHGGGVTLLCEIENEPIGMVMGIINPNIWSDKTLVCHQILLFIDEEYRHTRAAHMLISEYNEACQNLVSEKRIQYFTLSAAKPMFDIDFGRFGYDCIEKTWISNGA